MGEDGPTHHGMLDLTYLMCVPNMIVAAPRDGDELRDLLYTAIQQNEKPFAIRYPRESVPRPVTEGRALSTIPIGSWETLSDGDDVAILATGTMVEAALSAVTMLSEQGCTASVINARFVKYGSRRAAERQRTL